MIDVPAVLPTLILMKLLHSWTICVHAVRVTVARFMTHREYLRISRHTRII